MADTNDGDKDENKMAPTHWNLTTREQWASLLDTYQKDVENMQDGLDRAKVVKDAFELWRSCDFGTCACVSRSLSPPSRLLGVCSAVDTGQRSCCPGRKAGTSPGDDGLPRRHLK